MIPVNLAPEPRLCQCLQFQLLDITTTKKISTLKFEKPGSFLTRGSSKGAELYYRGAEIRIKLDYAGKFFLEKSRRRKSNYIQRTAVRGQEETPFPRGPAGYTKIKPTFPFSSPTGDSKENLSTTQIRMPSSTQSLSPMLPEPLEVKRVKLGSAESINCPPSALLSYGGRKG